ncbi:MAG: protein kinase [Gemmatimonadetes bacterium]|nr:protein kinase [Gemmatimonadota bacterium]
MTARQVRCPSCGTDLEADDRFCARCGAALPSTPTVPSGEQPAAPAEADAKLEARLHEALAPKYLLVRRLGSGGMGTVFLAREPALKREVAVKVLAPALAADATSRVRFQREAQAVAGISHPNVVSIYAVGELDDGTPYFIMQHVGGESLAARIEREGPADLAEGRRILGQIASALTAAHARGIIHRDIKAANVLYDDESARVLVTDFGIAAVLPTGEADAPTHLTGTGLAIGTPQYMSPEQLLAEKVTEKTDIYSLGLLAYELLTGQGPFAISSPREIMAAHLRDAPRRLAELRPDVDPELESVLAGCLAKDPTARPDAAALAKRLGTTEAVLEWPPPEQDELLGAVPRAARRLASGSFLFALPPLLMIAFGPRAAGSVGGVGVVALGLLALVGFLVIAIETWRLGRTMREAGRAVGGGYGWLTVLEVLADVRGDTGALLAGAREYAQLAPDARSRLRLARLAAALTYLLAALAPAPLLALTFGLGAAGAIPVRLAPVLVFLPMLLLTAAAGMLGRQEARTVAVYRKRLRRRARPAAGPRRLVEAWYETFETARRGQPLARGPAHRPALGRLAAAAAMVLAVGAGALAIPVILLGVLGKAWWGLAFPNFANMEEKLRIASIARPYRASADTTIAPLAAGAALVTLHGGTAASPFPARTDGRAELPPWFPPGSPVDVTSLWRSDSLIVQTARDGLTPELRRYLERVAANPRFTQLAVLGRSRRMDYVGARFRLPFPDSVIWLDVPILRFMQTKEAAYANVARAALLVADGRRAEAETALRETIGFGLLVMDESTTPIETLIGAVITGIGRGGLLGFYVATGRDADARALRAAYDSVVSLNVALDSAQAAALSPLASQATAVERYLAGLLADTTVNRGVRWEALRATRYGPCTNLRELIFGPSAELEAAVGSARRHLVRYLSEAALFDLILASPERYPRRLLPEKSLARLTFDLARVTGALLGNPRIPGCAGPLVSVVSGF